MLAAAGDASIMLRGDTTITYMSSWATLLCMTCNRTEHQTQELTQAAADLQGRSHRQACCRTSQDALGY